MDNTKDQGITDRDLRIVVVPVHKDKKTKQFAVRKRLSKDEEVYLRPADCIREDGENGIYNEAYPLAKAIFEVEGVDTITIDGLDVYVTVGLAFSWAEKEIKKGVILAIKEYIKFKIEAKKEAGRFIGGSDTR